MALLKAGKYSLKEGTPKGLETIRSICLLRNWANFGSLGRKTSAISPDYYVSFPCFARVLVPKDSCIQVYRLSFGWAPGLGGIFC